MESFNAWLEKQQIAPPPPILPLTGEATNWLASLDGRRAHLAAV